MTGGRLLAPAAALVLLAVGWAAVWTDVDRSVLSRVPVLDEAFYLREAAAIAEGRLAPQQPFIMSPLYPYLVAAAGGGRMLDEAGVRSGPPPTGLRIVQACCWLAILVLLHLAARMVLPPWAALVPPLLFALYRPAAIYATTVLLEIPLTLCVTAALLLLTLWERARAGEGVHLGRRGLGLAAGVGLSIAAATLLRPVALLLAAPAGALLGRGPRRRGRLIVMVAAVLVPLLPVIGFNSWRAGRPAGISLNGGLNLYLGVGPEAAGLFTTFAGFDFESDPAGVSYLSQRLGRPVGGPGEADRVWAGLAWEAVKADPARAVALWLKKLWLHFVGWEIDQVTPLAAWSRASPLLRALPVPYGLLAAAGLAGGWTLIARRLRRRAPGARETTGAPAEPGGVWSPGLAPWLSALAVLAAGQSLFFVVSRYRLVLVPALCLLAGVWVAELARRRGRAQLAAAIVGMAAFMLTRPWGFEPAQARWEALGAANEAARWERLADASAQERAEQLYRAALEMDAGLYPAARGLAGLLQRAARGEEAERVLRRAVLRSDTPQPLRRDLIHLLLARDQVEAALPHMVEYLRDSPADPDMLHNLSVGMARLDRPEQAMQVARRLIEAAPDDPRGYADLGTLLARAGRRAEARAAFQRGLQRLPADATLRSNLRRLDAEAEAGGAARAAEGSAAPAR